MDETRGRGRARGRGRGRGRGRAYLLSPNTQTNTSRPDKSPSPIKRFQKLVRVQNQRQAVTNRVPAQEEKTVNRDWVDLETHDDLLFRLNMFSLGWKVGDDEALKESDSLEIQRSKREQLLKRFVRDNLKQLLCDLKNKPKPTLETVVRNQIERTLEYFKNEMKGGDYEYVSCNTMIPTSLFVTHTNFYARLKGSDSPPELFFAVLENGCPHEATHCCKLDHDGNRTLQPGEVVRHCEHVKCLNCARWSGYVIRSGEDVIM